MASKERLLMECNSIDDECEEGEIKDDSCYEDLSSDEIFLLEKEKDANVEFQRRSEFSNCTATASRVSRPLISKARKMSSHVEMLQEKENRDGIAKDIPPSKVVLRSNLRKRSSCAVFQESSRRRHDSPVKTKRKRHSNINNRKHSLPLLDTTDVSDRSHMKKKHNVISHHKVKAPDGKQEKLRKHHKKPNLNGSEDMRRKHVKRTRKLAGLIGPHTVSANTSLRRRLLNMGITLPTLDLSTTSQPSSPPRPSGPSPPSPPPTHVELAPSLPPPQSPSPPQSPLPPPSPSPPPPPYVELPPLLPPPNSFSPVHLDASTICTNEDDDDQEIIVLPVPEKPPVEVIDIVSSPEVIDGECNSPEHVFPYNSNKVELQDQVAAENEVENFVNNVAENNSCTEGNNVAENSTSTDVNNIDENNSSAGVSNAAGNNSSTNVNNITGNNSSTVVNNITEINSSTVVNNITEINSSTDVNNITENNSSTDASKGAEFCASMEDEDVLQLRLVALRSAILKKHQNRQKRGILTRQYQQALGTENSSSHCPSLETAGERVSNEEPDEITTLVDMELADTDEEKDQSEENNICEDVPLTAPVESAQLTWDHSCSVYGPQVYPLPTSYVPYDTCVVPYCSNQPAELEYYKDVHIEAAGNGFIGANHKEDYGVTYFKSSPVMSTSNVASNCNALPETCQSVDCFDRQLVGNARSGHRPEDEMEDDATAIDLASMIVLDEVGPEDEGQMATSDIQEEQDEEDEELLRAKLLQTMTKTKQKQNMSSSVFPEVCSESVSDSHMEEASPVTFDNTLPVTGGTLADVNCTLTSADASACSEDTSAFASVPAIPVTLAGPTIGLPIPSLQRSFRRIRQRTMQANRNDNIYSRKQVAKALRYTRNKVNLPVPDKAQSLKVMVPVMATPQSSQRFVICLKDDDESDSGDETSLPKVSSSETSDLEEKISMFLKQARMNQEATQKLEPTSSRVPTQIPQSQQEEYKRQLKDQVVKLEEMNRLRRLQLASASTKSLSPVRPLARRIVKPTDGLMPTTSAEEKAAWQTRAERLVTATNKLTVTISQQKPASSSSIASCSTPTKPQVVGVKPVAGISKNTTAGNTYARKPTVGNLKSSASENSYSRRTLVNKVANKETCVVKAQQRQLSFRTNLLSAEFSPDKHVQQPPSKGILVTSNFDTAAKPASKNSGKVTFSASYVKQLFYGSNNASVKKRALRNNGPNIGQNKTSKNITSVTINSHSHEMTGLVDLVRKDDCKTHAETRVLEVVPVQSENVQLAQKSSGVGLETVQLSLVSRIQLTDMTNKQTDSSAVSVTAENVTGQTASSENSSQLGHIRQENVAKIQPTPVEKLAVVTDAKHELLHNLEEKLHTQRCSVLDDMTDTWDLLRRIEQGQEKEDECLAEVNRLKAELRRAEQHLESQRKDVADMRTLVVQSYGRVMKGKDACKELGKRCLTAGSAIHGRHYRVPSAREELMVAKLRQIADYTRRLSKKKTLSNILSHSQVSTKQLPSERPSVESPVQNATGIPSLSPACDETTTVVEESAPSSCCSSLPGAGDDDLAGFDNIAGTDNLADADNLAEADNLVDADKLAEADNLVDADAVPGREEIQPKETLGNAKTPGVEEGQVSSRCEASDTCVTTTEMQMETACEQTCEEQSLEAACVMEALEATCEEQEEEETIVTSREHRGSILGLEGDNTATAQCAGRMQPTAHFWPSNSKWAGKIDPRRPLCPYELRGSCRDQECLYQHVWDKHA